MFCCHKNYPHAFGSWQTCHCSRWLQWIIEIDYFIVNEIIIYFKLATIIAYSNLCTMSDEEVSQLIIKEFSERTLGVTEQYLELHEAIYENGFPKIDRIDRESRSNLVIAYLPVKDEYFSFAVYIDPEKREIFNMGTESRNLVYLRATSELLTSIELQSFTKLKASKAWNKEDFKPNKKSRYSFSCIEFNPNPEPDEFEDKLKNLINFLEEDKNGILELAAHSNAYIQVIMDFHAGNQLLGSAFINLESIRKLNELNLEVSFDFTAWGKPFK